MEHQAGSDSRAGPQEGSAPGRSQAWGVGRAGVLCNPLKLSSLAQTSPVSGLVPPPFTPLSAPRSTPVTTTLQLSRLHTGPTLLPLPGMSSPCHQANFSSSFKIQSKSHIHLRAFPEAPRLGWESLPDTHSTCQVKLMYSRLLEGTVSSVSILR